MNTQYRGLIIATGLAMFSMFFGAGNVVFPLSLGRAAQDGNSLATIGLLVTAVLIPLTGVIGLVLFNGNYNGFFSRLGRIPGELVIFMTLLLIGPGGATPRTITLSHATISAYTGPIPLWSFSLVACMLVFLFTFRPSKVLDLLGYYLTPILLGSLALIVLLGLWNPPEAGPAPMGALNMIWMGVETGYNTMDLLGAFFFSHIALQCFKAEVDEETAASPKKMVGLTIQAGAIAAILLGMVYAGFSTIASRYGSVLSQPDEQLLGAMAVHILGAHAAIIACVAVALACLTTAIALCTVFAEYIQKDLSRGRISYFWALIITLTATFAISTLEFSGIAAFLAPVLRICYPALIVLTFCNIANKLWNFPFVKTPVAITLAISTWTYFFAV